MIQCLIQPRVICEDIPNGVISFFEYMHSFMYFSYSLIILLLNVCSSNADIQKNAMALINALFIKAEHARRKVSHHFSLVNPVHFLQKSPSEVFCLSFQKIAENMQSKNIRNILLNVSCVQFVAYLFFNSQYDPRIFYLLFLTCIKYPPNISVMRAFVERNCIGG